MVLEEQVHMKSLDLPGRQGVGRDDYEALRGPGVERVLEMCGSDRCIDTAAQGVDDPHGVSCGCCN